ncbi:MAG: trypsin-like peptidase domain-containing protein [Sedimentisphaerales bacterium]|nr:trypsin-like peptidase domain-containing protein [Sedimentisphaerales bacterium]
MLRAIGFNRKVAVIWFLLAVLTVPAVSFAVPPEPLTAAETDLAAQINNTFRRAVQQVMPAVVFIDVRGNNGQPLGLGSGFIIDPAGYVVTNNHVVADGSEVDIILPDGRRFSAQDVRCDPDTDLAVVQIDPGDEELPYAVLGDSSELQVGDFVIAIGSPFGLQQTVTTGVVSFLGRQTGVLRGGVGGDVNPWAYENFIQTDAVINRGNSGGPLVNLYGQVIGINSNILSPTGVSAGYGFAVPSDLVRFVTSELIAHGQVRRGYLGVTMQNRTLEELRNLPEEYILELSRDLPEFLAELPEDVEGVLIHLVVPNTPAAEAGLEGFDIITAIDGNPIVDDNQLRNLIATMAPGTEATFSVWRDGEMIDFDIVLGDRDVAKAMEEQNHWLAQSDPRNRSDGPGRSQSPHGNGPRLGVSVRQLDSEAARFYGLDSKTRGVIIVEVIQGSLAQLCGLRVGEVITHVNGAAIQTVDQLRDIVSQTDFETGAMQLSLVSPIGRRTVLIQGSVR